ncbi:MAG: 4Fe-4S dicluster domain-containing protein [Spirochaetia bacterium]
MQRFKAGINFKKHISSPVGRSLAYSALPPIARVPLLQHSGPCPTLVVGLGERVTEGQLIAEKSCDSSARVHAPVPGIISAVVDVILPNGENTQIVEIETGGLFRKTRQTLPRSLESFNKVRLLNEFSDRGVVDHDFSAIPAHIKYNKEDPISYLVVRLTDADAYSAIQEQILNEQTEAVCEGLIVMSKLLSPEVIVLCTTTKEEYLISNFIEVLAGRLLNVQPLVVSSLYPYGTDEMIKIQLSGQSPVTSSGSARETITVVRPSFLYQVQQSVLFGASCIDRPITIAGGALIRPANMVARIGTPVKFLLEECGGFKAKPDRIIVGTQQSGFVVTDLNMPIGKDTSMILALTKNEVMASVSSECNNCGLCNEVCPVGLIPSEAHQAVLSNNIELTKSYMLENCLTCGACSHICPSHIPLNLILAKGKKISQENIEDAHVIKYKPS